MNAWFHAWLRRVFPRYFLVKDACAAPDQMDRRVERALAAQQQEAERLTSALIGLRLALPPDGRKSK